MRINFEPSRMIPAENARFQPCQNAKQVTEVFVQNNLVKMKIVRSPIQAGELI